MKKQRLSDYIKLYPKQKQAFGYIGKGGFIFYGGARGGGKTHLARVGSILTARQFPGIRVVVIRRFVSELFENFIDIMLQDYPEQVFGYKFLAQRKIFQFDNGSQIIFRSCTDRRDAEKIQGIEYQLMVIDEANQHTVDIIKTLIGSLRNARIPNYTETLLMTGNPGGKSDRWFKSHYVNPDHKFWMDHELKHRDKYIFVPAGVDDNPSINQNYIAHLESQPEHRRKAWLEGDWDVFHGQFFEEFWEEVHVVDPFTIPSHWERVIGIDLGFTEDHPTVALWLAQDPEDLTVYVYKEYVGYGKGFSVETAAQQVAEEYGMEDNYAMVYADPSMFDETTKLHGADQSAAELFQSYQIPVLRANNKRESGWAIVKQWLHWSQEQPPLLKFFSTCDRLIQNLPTLSYDPAKRASGMDLDTDQADDEADALRYALVSGFRVPTQGELSIHKDSIQKDEVQKQAHKTYDEKIANLKDTSGEIDLNFINRLEEARKHDYASGRNMRHKRAIF